MSARRACDILCTDVFFLKMHPRRFLLLLILGALVGYAWFRYDHSASRAVEKATLVETPKLNLDDVKVLAALDGEYARLIQSVVPSVVSITSSRTVLQAVPMTLEDMILRRQRAQEATSTSLGSGVIVSKEGHILTNNHVIAGMTEIRVQLTDGRNIEAKLIGRDPATDIAVLRIEAPNIEALPFGDSDQLHVGQQVFAVGNPYGLEESVSRGIISARRRTASDSGAEALQHDAAVNPGNSGGPLLNIRGEVIGINSSIKTVTGGFQGISFAIPSGTARRIMESILSGHRYTRGWLGLNTLAITQRLAEQFRLPDTRGAIISSIVPGSPAERAGLRPGDVVRQFNKQAVETPTQLSEWTGALDAGNIIEATIYREGREAKVKLPIAEMPPQPPQPQQP